MNKQKPLGYSANRTRQGIITTQTKGKSYPYLKVPYRLLQAKDFLNLSPLATKVFWIIVRQWKTNEPDEPIEISIDRIRELCPSSSKKGGHISRNKIAMATKQLTTFGFIHKVNQYKQCNKYYVVQKWFTGEYS